MKRWILIITLCLISGLNMAQTSNELAAVLEVLEPGVTVQRVNTNNPIAVNVEAIVGVGDVIRTDASGRARITFFADGTDTELLPNTEYRIETFEGNDDEFRLSVSVLAGQTVQRLSRIIDTNSSYDIHTPAMQLAARGTTFAIRVENNGRSGMIVSEGTVTASADESTADVPVGFGVRATSREGLSDVVPATSFEELDAALDGCQIAINVIDDVRFNVRVSPSLEAQRVGTVDPAEVEVVIGVNQSGGWYRIPFRGGYGWFLSSTAEVTSNCAGLRVFPDDQLEDISLYDTIGDPIELP
ncbi:MAG: hypothetical protein D6711_02065 [Chloroflexi bacterium]|nr:MAG: hypothetical protein D6711_02065 [Chloroflexota bacterium]